MAIDVTRSKIVIAGVSYIKPVFRANYTQIRVTAEVTFPDFLGVEVLTPTDLVTLSTVKSISEVLVTTEIVAQAVGKPLTDIFTIADAISLQTIYTRSFSEGLTSGDSQLFATQLSKTEDINPTDNLSLQFASQLSDSVTMIDMMDGDLDFFLLKVLSDFNPIADQYLIDFLAEKSDTMSLSDTGFILSQDYVEFGYFAQDYVGSGQIF